MADDIVVVVEPPLPSITSVVVEPPLPAITVTVSSVALAGPPGDPTVLLTQLEPPIDLTLVFENALA